MIKHDSAVRSIRNYDSIQHFESVYILFLGQVKILVTDTDIEAFNARTRELTSWAAEYCKFDHCYLYYNNRRIFLSDKETTDFSDILDRQYFVFENRDDAMLFKLTWHGELVFDNEKEIDY